MRIRILLADDHKLLREGLRALVEEQPDLSVIAEAEDGRAAVQLARKLLPDIVVMDISMPGLNGIEAARQIMSASYGIRILALSMHDDARFVTEMLDAGASGYLLKDCAFEELIQAIHVVAGQGTYVSSKIHDIAIKGNPRPSLPIYP